MSATEPLRAPTGAQHASGGLAMTRTWTDVLVGGVLVGTGVVVLGDVVLAGVISVLFIGWTLIIGGVIALATSAFLVRRAGFWVGLLGGLLSLVAGVVFVRHPGITLAALSLAIGGIMFINGVTRLAAAIEHRSARVALAISGLLSLLLGLLVFMQWPSSALWLIGTLLGIHLIIDGLLLIIAGRLRPIPD